MCRRFLGGVGDLGPTSPTTPNKPTNHHNALYEKMILIDFSGFINDLYYKPHFIDLEKMSFLLHFVLQATFSLAAIYK